MSDESSEIGNRWYVSARKTNAYCKNILKAFNAPTGADPGEFPREFDFIILPYILYVFGQTGLSKQCRPR